MTNHLNIAGHKIGPGHPVFIIAEAGVNHNGSLARAKELVDVAAAANVDAVKFQTFKTENVISSSAPKAAYQKETTGATESQLEMVKKLEITFDAFRELEAYCKERGVMFLSTPFDNDSVDLLTELHVPAYKVPSGEITNDPLLSYIACKGQPIIMSTGMATMGEVEAALKVIYSVGNRQVALLHCVSNYPANPSDANLRAMHTMELAFGVPIGFSDHTLGVEVSLAAVALGACIIEKHFTLDKNLPGPDHRASLDPVELKVMVVGIRKIEAALGNGYKEPATNERDTASVARRSVVAACRISAGTILTEQMLMCKRPGTGLPPRMIPMIVGRRIRTDILSGELISLAILD